MQPSKTPICDYAAEVCMFYFQSLLFVMDKTPPGYATMIMMAPPLAGGLRSLSNLTCIKSIHVPTPTEPVEWIGPELINYPTVLKPLSQLTRISAREEV